MFDVEQEILQLNGSQNYQSLPAPPPPKFHRPNAAEDVNRPGEFFSASNAFSRQKMAPQRKDPWAEMGGGSMASFGQSPAFDQAVSMPAAGGSGRPRAPLVAPRGPGLVSRGGIGAGLPRGPPSSNSLPMGGGFADPTVGRIQPHPIGVGGAALGGMGFNGNSGAGTIVPNLAGSDVPMPPKVMLIIRRVSRTGDLQVADVADLKAALNSAIETGVNVDALVNIYKGSLDNTTLGLIFDEAVQAKLLAYLDHQGASGGPLGSYSSRGIGAPPGAAMAKGAGGGLGRQSAFGILATPPVTGPLGAARRAPPAAAPAIKPPNRPLIAPPTAPPATRAAPSETTQPLKGWPEWFPPGRSYLFDPSVIIDKINPTFLESLAKGTAELTLNNDDLRYIRDFFIQHCEYQKLNPFPILALVTFYLSAELLEKLFENNKMNTLFEESSKKWELKPVEYEAVSTGELFPLSKPQTLKLHMTEATIRYLQRTIDCDQGGVMGKSDGDVVYGKRLKQEPAEYALEEIPGVEVQPNGTAHLNPRVRKWISSVLYVMARKNAPHDQFIARMREYFGQFEVECFLNQPRIKRSLEKAIKNAENFPLQLDEEPNDTDLSGLLDETEPGKKPPMSAKAIKAQIAICKLEPSLESLRLSVLEEQAGVNLAPSRGQQVKTAVAAPATSSGAVEQHLGNGSAHEGYLVEEPTEGEEEWMGEEGAFEEEFPLGPYPIMGGGGPGTGRPPMIRPPGMMMRMRMPIAGPRGLMLRHPRMGPRLGGPGMGVRPRLLLRPRLPMAMMMRMRGRGGPRPMMRPPLGLRGPPGFPPRF